MSAKGNGTRPKKKEPRSDPAVSYDEFKEYEGKKYTGMKVGRSHKWYFDQGVWKETKITPDLWQISYAVTKRRAGRAPEGSGVPVGTEYHWYIIAHQNVKKLNANDYTTSMAGLKFKVAHKRADSEKWSATPKTQRKRLIAFIREVIADLEEQTELELTSAADAKKQADRGKKKTAPAPRSRKAAKKEPAVPRSMTRPARRRRKTPA
jgi:hypothetical protein